jgi:hypothetical protein
VDVPVYKTWYCHKLGNSCFHTLLTSNYIVIFTQCGSSSLRYGPKAYERLTCYTATEIRFAEWPWLLGYCSSGMDCWTEVSWRFSIPFVVRVDSCITDAVLKILATRPEMEVFTVASVHSFLCPSIVCLSVCLSIYLSVSLSVRPSVHPSIHPSTHLSILPCIRPSIHPSVSVYLSVCPSVHPSIRLSVYNLTSLSNLSDIIYPSVYLCLRLSIHQTVIYLLRKTYLYLSVYLTVR